MRAVVLAVLLVGCATVHDVRPDGTTIDITTVGRATVDVCKGTGLVTKDCDHVETPGLSSNLELVLAGLITTLGSLAMAGVF